MENKSTFQQSFGGIAALLLLNLIIASGVLGYFFLNKTNNTSQHMVNEELPILMEIQNMEYGVLRINSSTYEKSSVESKEFEKIESDEIKEGTELFSKSFLNYKHLISEHYRYETQKTDILQEKFHNFLKNSDVFANSVNLETRESFEKSEKEILNHLNEIKTDWNKHIQKTKDQQNSRSFKYEIVLISFTVFAALFAILLGYFFKRADQGWKMSQLKLMDNSRLASLGEMAGGIAHEINNPLTIIKMKAVALRKKFAKGEMDEKTFKSGMDTIDDTVGRISKIIKGLKTLAHGNIDDIETIKIKEVFETVLSVCDDKMRSRGITFKVDYEADSFNQLVKCSTVQLSQVIINMLKNSIDAIEEHQDINEERWISIDTAFRNNRIYFYFNDSGPGIPDEHKKKIFDPFFTTKPIGKGTGLGMPICKSIVESHDGTLTLAENRNKDGNFILELPIVTGEELFSEEPTIH